MAAAALIAGYARVRQWMVAARRQWHTLAAPAALVVASLLTPACTSGLIELPGSVGGGSDPGLLHVVFLSNAPPEALPPEEAAAWMWLQRRDDIDARQVQFIDLLRTELPPDAILWWHYAAEEALPSIAVRPENLRAVRRHLAGGGSLLLSLIAASYTVPLEIESSPPDTVSRRAPFVAANDEVGGFQSLGHPLAQRFWGGVLPSANRDYPPRPAVAYTGDRWPDEGHAWAVHKSERGADPTTKIGIEYTNVFGAGGTVLTLGAHCYFADAGNRNRAQLEQLLVDTLSYLDRQSPATPPGALIAAADVAEEAPETGTGGDGPRYWGPSTRTFVVDDIDPGDLPPAADADLALNRVERSRSGIELTRYDDREPFTLTSRRALLRGSQRGYIDEFRVHPRQLLSELRFAIVRPDRGVTWLDTGAGSRTFTARPEGAELFYNDGELEIHLHLAVDRRYPALVALITVRSPAAVDIIVTWRAHAGAEIPQGASPVEPPLIGWDDGAQAFVWRSADGFAVKGGFGRETPLHILGFEPAVHLADSGLVASPNDGAPIDAAEREAGADPAPLIDGVDSIDRDPASVALQVHIEPGRPAVLPLVIVGGPAGEVDVDRAFGELVATPGRVWVDNARYFRDFLGSNTMELLAPDRTFSAAFKWAKVGIDALGVHSPGVGTGIVSGFGTTRSGDAWVATPNTFGGSGVLWAAMAADAYGDRQLAADTLQMMARYQGVDGRIPDAIGPSRQIVENSVGPTALFVIALENHLRTWGDEALLNNLWPAVQHAIAYLFGADGDDDGLVNGASRLDRWSEDRAVQTPIDLAALWAAALQACERMAKVVGDDDLASRSADAVARVRPLLNEAFWNPTERTYSFTRRADGSFVPVSTVLPAVPMIFKLLDPGRATAALDSLSSSAFSRDWGVGLVGITPPPMEALSNAPSALTPVPTGLPSDAADLVSPVFTGWTALAEYANNRPVAGFAHALTNLLLLEHGGIGTAAGAFDPVAFTTRTGIPHAAGAQAMTLLPVIWGTLGIHPDALNRSISISPQLPANWAYVHVPRVRVGDSSFNLQIRRTSTQTQFRVDNWRGDRDIELSLTVRVPSDLGVTMDPDTPGFEIVSNETIVETTQRAATVVVRPAPNANAGVLTFNYDPFPRLVPPAQLTARPLEATGGLRVIRARYLGGVMAIKLEGLPGQTYTLTLASPWNVSQVTGVPDARIGHPEEGMATITITIPGSGSRYRPIDLEVFFDR